MTTQRGPVNSARTGLERANGNDAATNVAASELINILDAVEVPVIVLRRDSTISYFNKAGADVLGLSPSDTDRASREIPVLAAIPHLEKHCSDAIATVGPLETGPAAIDRAAIRSHQATAEAAYRLPLRCRTESATVGRTCRNASSRD